MLRTFREKEILSGPENQDGTLLLRHGYKLFLYGRRVSHPSNESRSRESILYSLNNEGQVFSPTVFF